VVAHVSQESQDYFTGTRRGVIGTETLSQNGCRGIPLRRRAMVVCCTILPIASASSLRVTNTAMKRHDDSEPESSAAVVGWNATRTQAQARTPKNNTNFKLLMPRNDYCSWRSFGFGVGWAGWRKALLSGEYQLAAMSHVLLRLFPLGPRP
jgi:hypothetical protein